jgi:hypothetical protein
LHVALLPVVCGKIPDEEIVVELRDVVGIAVVEAPFSGLTREPLLEFVDGRVLVVGDKRLRVVVLLLVACMACSKCW